MKAEHMDIIHHFFKSSGQIPFSYVVHAQEGVQHGYYGHRWYRTRRRTSYTHLGGNNSQLGFYNHNTFSIYRVRVCPPAPSPLRLRPE